ncbi:MAG TPA: Rv3654c family TadE-like protein [Mycobacteriales bacterium]|jgi:secretion/DNA translocation related TadE-like protein|nr:Rv3654c family TadE-like protein [Mycobacteriales bacterium]
MNRRCEDGSATVLALATCAVLAAVTAVLAGLALAAVARHRAALASDAAALAAASHAAEGAPAACRAAARSLEANGGRLLSCAMDGSFAVVRGRVAAAGWIAWAGSAEGEARAGPDADAEKTGGVARAS